MADVKKGVPYSESFKKFNLLPLPSNSYSHQGHVLWKTCSFSEKFRHHNTRTRNKH